MKNPHILTGIIGSILFFALILEANTHYKDVEYYRSRVNEYLDVIQSQHETIVKQQQDNKEIQDKLDRIYGYAKRK